VVSVVLFHGFPGLLPGGFVGVDIFFVISGYLITRIIVSELENRSFSVRHFYSRRARRILPALSLLLAAGLLFGWAVLLPGEWESLGQQVAAGAFFFSNALFMNGRGYFDAPSESVPLLHLWSLAIEEQFYLAWPFLLILIHRLHIKGCWPLVVLAAASFISLLCFEDRDQAFFCTATRVWQLAIGGLIAWSQLVRRQPDRALSEPASSLLQFSRRLLPTVGLVLICASVLYLNRSTPYPGVAALAPTLGAAFVILDSPDSTASRRLLSAPIVVWVGLISYPLYLWHWPLLAFANILGPEASTVGVRLALVSLSLVLSVATYRLLEVPIRQLGAITVVVLVYSIGTLGVAGYYAQHGRLAPHSLNQPEMIPVVEAQRDWDFPPQSLTPIKFNDSIFYGRTGAGGRVVFIGDSNIQQYAPRVDAIAGLGAGVTKSVLFATHGGCLPIRGVTEDAHPGCETFLRDAMVAALSGDVTSVVIGASWHSYFTSKNDYRFNRADGMQQPIGAGGSGANEAFASLAAMIRELRGAGKEVFLLLNMPVGTAFDPSISVSRPLVSRFLPAPKTSMSRQEVETMLSVVNEKLTETADVAGAQIIDPVKFLCSDELCTQFDADGTSRYKDATHLRASYVRRSVEFLDSQLVPETR
jgi:peptidoglycan/LPS O-acetylase OafA/YrhL